MEILERLVKIETELGVVKTDLGVVKTDLGVVKTELGVVKTELGVVKTEMRAVKTEVRVVKTGVDGLTAYNSRRDGELEEEVQAAFVESLVAGGWHYSQIMANKIYNIEGKQILEWDGVFQVTHPKKKLHRLVVIETKQLFNRNKYVEFRRRFCDMKAFLLSITEESLDVGHLNYIRVAKQFLPCKEYVIKGVLGSPCFI